MNNLWFRKSFIELQWNLLFFIKFFIIIISLKIMLLKKLN